MAYQDELIENYRELASERGWSGKQMADHLEDLDPKLAAEFRERAGKSKPEARSEAPKGRRSADKSEA